MPKGKSRCECCASSCLIFKASGKPFVFESLTSWFCHEPDKNLSLVVWCGTPYQKHWEEKEERHAKALQACVNDLPLGVYRKIMAGGGLFCLVVYFLKAVHVDIFWRCVALKLQTQHVYHHDHSKGGRLYCVPTFSATQVPFWRFTSHHWLKYPDVPRSSPRPWVAVW